MRSIYVLAVAALIGCLGSPPDGALPSGEDAGADQPTPPDAAATVMDLIPGGTPSTTAPLGGTGGGGYDAFCPDDRFVTGLRGEANGAGMTSVQAICSRFQVAGGEVALIDSVDGDAIVGDTDATVLDPIECSPGLVAVAYDGSANGNEVVSHLRFACAPIGWEGVAVVRQPSEQTEKLGTPDDSEVGGDACPEGMAAGGISGRYGLLIDAFQLECFEVVARPAQ